MTVNVDLTRSTALTVDACPLRTAPRTIDFGANQTITLEWRASVTTNVPPVPVAKLIAALGRTPRAYGADRRAVASSKQHHQAADPELEAFIAVCDMENGLVWLRSFADSACSQLTWSSRGEDDPMATMDVGTYPIGNGEFYCPSAVIYMLTCTAADHLPVAATTLADRIWRAGLRLWEPGSGLAGWSRSGELGSGSGELGSGSGELGSGGGPRCRRSALRPQSCCLPVRLASSAHRRPPRLLDTPKPNAAMLAAHGSRTPARTSQTTPLRRTLTPLP